MFIDTLRRTAPLVASAVLLATLGVCLALTLALDRYIGGIKLPYFSDMGRDAPSYYVFSVGLSIVALAILTTWVLNCVYQSASLRLRVRRQQVSRSVRVWSAIVVVLGVLSTPGLPILSFCSTSACPSIHPHATYWFFVLETLALVINTWIMNRLLRVQQSPTGDLAAFKKTHRHLRRTVRVQVICTALLVVVALMMIPIGFALREPIPRLSVQECLAKQLGTKYCTSTMRYDQQNTKLWNYEKNFAPHQVRAVCEWVAMLALVGYSLSFLLYRDVEVEHSLDAGHDALDTSLLAV